MTPFRIHSQRLQSVGRNLRKAKIAATGVATAATSSAPAGDGIEHPWIRVEVGRLVPHPRGDADEEQCPRREPEQAQPIENHCRGAPSAIAANKALDGCDDGPQAEEVDR